MRLKLAVSIVAGVSCLFAAATVGARADGLVDPSRAGYLETFKGKKVAFVPIAMGFDLAQAWSSQLAKQAEELGYSYVVRDPNWSTEAGAQALTQLIAEKPDLIVVHSPDIQSYARLLKQAEAAGIYTLQVNMKSAYVSEGYVGSDYNGLGELAANLIVKQCGQGSGKSGKVSIVQGVLTGGASVYQIEGVERIFKQHPEIKVVSNQAADWDASKAKAITQTVLQQNPDLCGVIGQGSRQDRRRLCGDVGRRLDIGLRKRQQRHVQRADQLQRHGARTRPEHADQGAVRDQAEARHREGHRLFAAHGAHKGIRQAG
jgi:ribose transport system substrate-binding protein